MTDSDNLLDAQYAVRDDLSRALAVDLIGDLFRPLVAVVEDLRHAPLIVDQEAFEVLDPALAVAGDAVDVIDQHVSPRRAGEGRGEQQGKPCAFPETHGLPFFGRRLMIALVSRRPPPSA